MITPQPARSVGRLSGVSVPDASLAGEVLLPIPPMPVITATPALAPDLACVRTLPLRLTTPGETPRGPRKLPWRDRCPRSGRVPLTHRHLVCIGEDFPLKPP